LNTLQQNNPNAPLIPAMRGRINTAIQNRDRRLAELAGQRTPDVESSVVAAGLFKVEQQEQL